MTQPKQKKCICFLAVVLLILSLCSCLERLPEDTTAAPSEGTVGTIPSIQSEPQTDQTEPTVTEPDHTAPATTLPAPTQTVPSEPYPTETAPTETAPTEPLPTAPTPTDTVPTQPPPTEPTPTKPVDKTAPSLSVTFPGNKQSAEPYYTEARSITVTGKISDKDSGVAGVTVNGVKAAIRQDQTWSATISLNVDTFTEITVIATDLAGNTAKQTRYAFCFVPVNQAVFTESDGSLVFTRGKRLKVGDQLDGRTVTEVYTGFDTSIYSSASAVPWHSRRGAITRVEFLADIAPVSTMYWFSDMDQCVQMDLLKLNTGKTVNMAYMFSGCSNLPTLDLSGFTTKNVVRMDGMFQNCSKIRTIYVSGGWSTASLIGSVDMFNGLTNIVGGARTTYHNQHLNADYARIDGGFRAPGYFTESGKAGEGDGYELYVLQETNRVIEQVASRQNNSTLSFILISDMHVMAPGEFGDPDIENQIYQSNLHAGQAMAMIADSIDIDLFVGLGDFAWGDNSTSIAEGVESIRMAKELLDGIMSRVDSVLIPGNHDALSYSFSQNGSYLDDSTLETMLGSYGYTDYQLQKIRVIYLNTSESEGTAITDSGTVENITPQQLQWFAKALDLSDKQDANAWGIIIMSHHPLDWGDIMPAANLLQSYLTGSKFTADHRGVKVEYDFSGKNAATVIANIHGHVHAYTVDYVHYLSNGAAYKTTVQRIAIPNSVFGRENEYGQNSGPEYYGIEFGQSVTYYKTPGTAEDTAFCVVTLDTQKRILFFDCYGAGYDRVIQY